MNIGRVATHDGSELLKCVWQLVRAEVLDTREFVIAGSARLWVENLIPKLSDLDIIVKESTWKRVWDLAISDPRAGGASRIEATFGKGTVDGAPTVQFFGGLIEISDHWIMPGIDLDQMIDTAEVIDGLRYISIEDIESYKRFLKRPKDIDDLRAIEISRGPTTEDPRSPLIWVESGEPMRT